MVAITMTSGSRPSRPKRVALAFAERRLVLAEAGEPPRSISYPEGLLRVSATRPNMSAVAEVGKLVASLMEGRAPRELAFVLPNLAVTTMVLPGGKRLRKRELLERVGSRLPFPAGEARVDFWKGARKEALAAAIRLSVVRQYEQLAELVGSRPSWMDAASLVSIPARARQSREVGAALTVGLELFEGHYSLAAFRGGELVDLRFKLRSPDDASSLASELARLPVRYDAVVGSLSLIGVGAGDVARELGAKHDLPHGSLSAEELGEEALLHGAASTLMARRL